MKPKIERNRNRYGELAPGWVIYGSYGNECFNGRVFGETWEQAFSFLSMYFLTVGYEAAAK